MKAIEVNSFRKIKKYIKKDCGKHSMFYEKMYGLGGQVFYVLFYGEVA